MTIMNEYDEFIAEAAEAVITTQKGLTSILQRTLKIGYKRASAIMEQLYSLGVVGQENGIQPRDEYPQYSNQLFLIRYHMNSVLEALRHHMRSSL